MERMERGEGQEWVEGKLSCVAGWTTALADPHGGPSMGVAG